MLICSVLRGAPPSFSQRSIAFHRYELSSFGTIVLRYYALLAPARGFRSGRCQDEDWIRPGARLEYATPGLLACVEAVRAENQMIETWRNAHNAFQV
jgi:hypothetical protein